MDNLTHSLVGALIGQAGLKKRTGLAMPALIIGANLPDVDAACFFWLEGVEHLGFRRGITHGPPALVLLPLLLAGLLHGFDRWQAKRGRRPEGRIRVNFGWLFALAFIGCLTHPALDWLNVYGIRLLEPFSSQWFYGDTLFIIDVWLWLTCIVCLLASLWEERRGDSFKGIARAGLAISLAYIAANALVTRNLETKFAGLSEHVIASPVPFIPWEREMIVYDAGRGAPNRASIFRWSLLSGPTSAIENVGFEAQDAGCQAALDSPADKGAEAFLFWSRVPVIEPGDDGRSVLLRDARFYDLRARDRFTVALPDIACDTLPIPSEL